MTLVASAREAAELLGVSERTIYNLIDAGTLPAIELGRRKVVPRRAIDLVIERSLAGFDPDTLLAGLAAAAHSSDAEHGIADVEEWTGTTGPMTGDPGSAARGPADPGTSRLRPLRRSTG